MDAVADAPGGTVTIAMLVDILPKAAVTTN